MNVVKTLLLVAVGIVVFPLLSFSQGSSEDNSFEQLIIIGEHAKNGIFDPAIEYEPDGSVGWMVYSVVQDFPKDVSTCVAKTEDSGKTWTKVMEVNRARKEKKKVRKKNVEGYWRHEVPTLVYDKFDPNPETRWKLFWHRFFAQPPFTGKKHRVVEYGWIALKTAPTPSGPWSDEVPLFGAGQFLASPYEAKIDANQLHPDLKDVVAYTEPGSLYKDGTLYLCLQAHVLKRRFLLPPVFNVKIVLLSSEDHGHTWGYLGTLTDEEDAKPFKSFSLVAPSLAEEQGRQFLMVSPLTTKDHYGTLIFEFKDIRKATLQRDALGRLKLVKFLPPTIIGNAGESDYDPHNYNGGIIMPQANVNAYPKILQIYNTHIKILD